MLAISIAISTALACETRTPGYWKTHPEEWPVSTTAASNMATFVGVFPYDGWGFVQSFPIPANALTILQMPVRGDARINLQQKVIAASLSILSDSNWGWNNDERYSPEALAMDGLPGMVADANLMLATPGPWTPGSAADESGLRADALELAGIIDYWLNFFDVD